MKYTYDIRRVLDKIMPINAPGHPVKKMRNRIENANEDNRSLLYNSGQVKPIQELEPNLNELQHSAMNSYRLRSEVIKTDHGFEVV